MTYSPLVGIQSRMFRQTMMNPYKADPTPLRESDRQAQVEMPVWDRVFDHQKYMQHEGPLKLSTGIAFLDVEPYPRMKLMKLYYLALAEIDQLPDEYGYKLLAREMTRFRMKVVDETPAIREIEDKIASGLIEELVFAAHNEVKLLRLMKEWKPWVEFEAEKENYREALHGMASFRLDNPFATVFENYEDMRHDREPRKEY